MPQLKEKVSQLFIDAVLKLGDQVHDQVLSLEELNKLPFTSLEKVSASPLADSKHVGNSCIN